MELEREYQAAIGCLTVEDIKKTRPRDIPRLVTTGVHLDQWIAELNTKLKAVKERLAEEAQAQLRMTGVRKKDLPGHTHTLSSTDGLQAEVCFPKDSLVRSFWLFKTSAWTYRDDQAVSLGNLKSEAGEHFGKLFSQLYKPAKAFRDLAVALLGKEKGEKLIGMCTFPSGPRVSFKTKKGNA